MVNGKRIQLAQGPVSRSCVRETEPLLDQSTTHPSPGHLGEVWTEGEAWPFDGSLADGTGSESLQPLHVRHSE